MTEADQVKALTKMALDLMACIEVLAEHHPDSEDIQWRLGEAAEKIRPFLQNEEQKNG